VGNFRKKRGLFKFLILGFLFACALFYVIYFWLFKKVSGKAIFLEGE